MIKVIQGQMSGIDIDAGGNYSFTVELPAGVTSSQVVSAQVYSRSVATQVGQVAASASLLSSWTNVYGVQFQGVTNRSSVSIDDLEILIVTTDDGENVGFSGRIIQ